MQVLYSRYYTPVKSGFLSDPTMMKGWQDVFQTTNKTEVEAELREGGQDFSWEDDNLRICSTQPAIETHPTSGKKIWFNHILVSQHGKITLNKYQHWIEIGVLYREVHSVHIIRGSI